VLLPHQGRAMQQKPSVSSKNRILSRLSADDKAFLKPDLEPVDLALRQVLETPNKPIKHSYFIEYGLASIVASNGHVWTAPYWQGLFGGDARLVGAAMCPAY